MRYVYGALTLLVAIACAIFAVSNRAPVSLSLWPIPGAIETPVFILVLGTTLVGLVLGLVTGWLISMPARLARRRLTMRLAVAEADVKRLKAQLAGEAAVALPGVPARLEA
jgi:uncharacterized integral membrane protein